MIGKNNQYKLVPDTRLVKYCINTRCNHLDTFQKDDETCPYCGSRLKIFDSREVKIMLRTFQKRGSLFEYLKNRYEEKKHSRKKDEEESLKLDEQVEIIKDMNVSTRNLFSLKGIKSLVIFYFVLFVLEFFIHHNIKTALSVAGLYIMLILSGAAIIYIISTFALREYNKDKKTLRS